MRHWSNVSNEDIRSGKYAFCDILDVYDYFHKKTDGVLVGMLRLILKSCNWI